MKKVPTPTANNNTVPWVLCIFGGYVLLVCTNYKEGQMSTVNNITVPWVLCISAVMVN